MASHFAQNLGVSKLARSGFRLRLSARFALRASLVSTSARRLRRRLACQPEFARDKLTSRLAKQGGALAC
jgi:hypothetical protein